MEKWTESLDKYLEEGKLPLVGEIFSRFQINVDDVFTLTWSFPTLLHRK